MRPIHSALEIVALIGQRQPIGVSAIARDTGLPKTTAHRVLQTLHAAGWIKPDANEGASWSLSIRAALAVGSAQRATRQLHGAAFPIMEELRNTTGESVYLAVRDADTLALIERLDGRNPLAHAWPLWQRGPLHATSLGKSMLAHLDPAELETCLNATLPRMTRQTKTDRAAIEAELAVTRARGFATSFRENWPNENGVGAAIRNAHGEPTAAISISAPVDRVGEAQCIAWGPLLVSAARRISLGLTRG